MSDRHADVFHYLAATASDLLEADAVAILELGATSVRLNCLVNRAGIPVQASDRHGPEHHRPPFLRDALTGGRVTILDDHTQALQLPWSGKVSSDSGCTALAPLGGQEHIWGLLAAYFALKGPSPVDDMKPLEISRNLSVMEAISQTASLFLQPPKRCRADQQSGRVPLLGLTPRELEVLHFVEHHFRNDEIARELHISPDTVKKHISAILSALGVRTRGEAVRAARHQGLIPGASCMPETLLDWE